MYLGRSVTGLLRAVKVVQRADFEHERTFEREFEGIQRYEQVSQGHRGLVDVLHVGRDDGEGFYYYVMELADDASGLPGEIDPGAYRARTLASDLREHAVRSVAECVAFGIRIGEALGHLHNVGLTHRDVKPSNIIFVKGKPKLADVGLVAQSGQRTYVGTEGYVPPEGPGTASADLYSLAMVLYEMHTGKDRLDFPELPTNLEIPPTVNRDEWRAINSVICRAGAPDPRKRFESASAFTAALRRIAGQEDAAAAALSAYTSGRSRPVVGSFAWSLLVLMLLAATGVGGFLLWKDRESFLHQHLPLLQADGPGEESGSEGDPERTEEEDGGDTGDGEPPEDTSLAQGGGEGSGKDQKSGDEGDKDSGENPGTDPLPPGDGEKDGDSVAIHDPPSDGGTGQVPEDGSGSTPPDETDGADKAEDAKKTGDIPGDDGPMAADGGEGSPGDVIVAKQAMARLKLISSPNGAEVIVDGKEVGRTPTAYLEFPAGRVSLLFRKEGFLDKREEFELAPGPGTRRAFLLQDRRPVPGLAWVNSQGLEYFRDETSEIFAGGAGWMSRGPVPIEPLENFAEASGRDLSLVSVGGAAPEVRDEALRWAFCDWMTREDRMNGFLDEEQYHAPLGVDQVSGGEQLYCRLDDRFGAVILNSDPEGARVFRNGEEIGETPLTLDRLRFGLHRLELRLGGHRAEIRDLDIEFPEPVAMVVELNEDGSLVYGKPWKNSLGMDLVPAEGLMAAVHETRTSDYRAYLADRNGGAGSLAYAGTGEGPDHPAAGISRYEAEGFCEWLTEKERALGLIEPWQRYRLPTDREWSRLAGLGEEEGNTPEEREESGVEHFLWGKEWPPQERAGNFADESAAGSPDESGRIAGYHDGYPRTAPVGSFDPAPNGLHDLAGNVWEWVADDFGATAPDLGVARGGSWGDHKRRILSATYRKAEQPGLREGVFGFRVVLVEER